MLTRLEYDAYRKITFYHLIFHSCGGGGSGLLMILLGPGEGGNGIAKCPRNEVSLVAN
jgi:hypothetical protein